ncbi:MAG: hypothetical protein HY698_21820 [Deltaproteobacteria bacterium]|nr:hypothetical protein [Deltaproteobacteria bacterium]
MGFEDEIDDILRELVRERGAFAAGLADAGEDPFSEEDAQGRSKERMPLGGGTELVVLIDPSAVEDLKGAIERAARELRSCVRRWNPESLAGFQVLGRLPRGRTAILRRISRYLEAFVHVHGAACAVVLRGSQVLSWSGNLDEIRRERLPFLRKRVDAEAARKRGKTSHAEVHGEDVYARSFGFDGYLVVFFERPYSLDFVRYRARTVTRELALLLPHLDDDPPASTQIRPRPEPTS